MGISLQNLKAALSYVKPVWRWSRLVFKTILRFFNLLEPDVPYMTLSLSKISVWMTLGLMVYVVITGKDMTDIGAALIGNVGSIANYAYRRRMQVKTGTGAYGNNTYPDDPNNDGPNDDPSDSNDDPDQPRPGPMTRTDDGGQN